MLTALIQQAKAAGQISEPGFAPKEIRWMAVIEAQRFVGVISLITDKKGKTYPTCPDMSNPDLRGLPRILGTRQGAHFLADTCGVVALLPSSDATTDTEQGKIRDKHTAYSELLRRASGDVAGLNQVLAVLSDEAQLQELQTALAQQGAKSTDKMSFTVDGTDLLSSEVWQPWWREFRALFGTTKAAGKGMLDLTDGTLVQPAPTHLKLTKLGVGAMSMGASLVSYDKDAFTSYGLTAGENGAVSEENAAAYRAALEQLLERAPILGQMKVIVWFDGQREAGQMLIDAIVDPSTTEARTDETAATDDLGWDDLDESAAITTTQSPEQRQAVATNRGTQLLQAIRSGDPPPPLTGHYFAMSLSGAAGRAMVRGWKTGTLTELAEAVSTWFSDLDIVNLRGKRANQPRFFTLLMNIQRPKSASTSVDDYLKPIRQLQLALWQAALNPNSPIPFSVITQIMNAHKAHVMTGKFTKAVNGEGEREEKSRIYVRMALLRAYHVRKSRLQGGPPMSPTIDPEHPNPAYHCGRLMYLLANLQEAQGAGINAGVVQRYYGAASTTPALVLGRLTRLSQHHIAKLARDRPGLAHILEQEIASVWAKIEGAPPRTLSLEDQSLFALGYYQQLAHNAATRREATTERTSGKDTTPTAEAHPSTPTPKPSRNIPSLFDFTKQ